MRHRNVAWPDLAAPALLCRSLIVANLSALSIGIFGCSANGPQLVEVTGRVTLDEKPLTNALVTYVPDGGDRAYSSGVTDQDGRYRLQYGRQSFGARPGPFFVMIEMAVEEGKSQPLPPRYNTKSELRRDVSENAANVIDIELTSNKSGKPIAAKR